jgi:hypothetical protein
MADRLGHEGDGRAVVHGVAGVCVPEPVHGRTAFREMPAWPFMLSLR